MPDTDDAPPPAPTPARIALGICAHVLHGRAEVLRSRTGRQGRHATQDDIAVRVADGRKRNVFGTRRKIAALIDHAKLDRELLCSC